MTVCARSLPPRSESTLAVDWLIEAPTTPRAEAPAPAPQPPRPVTPTPQAVPAPVAPVAQAETPVAPPTPTANPAPPTPAVPVPAESRAAATPTPFPAPLEAPRFDADYLHNPAPDYPALSRRFGEEGRVVLRVAVSADGTARQVEVAKSSGSPRLDAAALDAVRRWRFQPARQGQQSLAGWVQVPINFRLNP